MLGPNGGLSHVKTRMTSNLPMDSLSGSEPQVSNTAAAGAQAQSPIDEWQVRFVSACVDGPQHGAAPCSAARGFCSSGTEPQVSSTAVAGAQAQVCTDVLQVRFVSASVDGPQHGSAPCSAVRDFCGSGTEPQVSNTAVAGAQAQVCTDGLHVRFVSAYVDGPQQGSAPCSAERDFCTSGSEPQVSNIAAAGAQAQVPTDGLQVRCVSAFAVELQQGSAPCSDFGASRSEPQVSNIAVAGAQAQVPTDGLQVRFVSASVDGPQQGSAPCSAVRDFCAFHGLVPSPNDGGGQCFWLSLSGSLGNVDAARSAVADWLRCSEHQASADADDVEAGCLTTEWQVNATVQANADMFGNGLLILHDPAAVGVRFFPGTQPKVVSLPAVAAYLQLPPEQRAVVLLYTESNTVGHFELIRCWSVAGKTCKEPPCSQVASLPARMLGGMEEPDSAPLASASASMSPRWRIPASWRGLSSDAVSDFSTAPAPTVIDLDADSPEAVTPNPAPLQRPRLASPTVGVAVVPRTASPLPPGSWGGPSPDAFRRHMRHVSDVFASRPPLPEALPAQVGPPCFASAPDAEVEFWVARLMAMPEDAACNFWRQMPMYTQYITEHSLAEVGQHMLSGVDALVASPMTGDQALEVAPRLGAVMPLPMAVYVLYCSRTTAKPVYFLADLAFTLLANLLHVDLRVNPYANDQSFSVCPRFWALPTGDTSAGKSPAF